MVDMTALEIPPLPKCVTMSPFTPEEYAFVMRGTGSWTVGDYGFTYMMWVASNWFLDIGFMDKEMSHIVDILLTDLLEQEFESGNARIPVPTSWEEWTLCKIEMRKAVHDLVAGTTTSRLDDFFVRTTKKTGAEAFNWKGHNVSLPLQGLRTSRLPGWV